MSFTSKQDFLARVETKLIAPNIQLEAAYNPELAGGELLDPDLAATRLKPAAVLMGLIERENDYDVVFTERPKTMTSHAGQVAFPGGKIDLQDESAAAAAVREAEEEIGLPRQDVRLLGQAQPYRTNSGYLVSLFVGELPPDFKPEPCPREVDDVFEAPLSFLMNPSNHQLHQREWKGIMRKYYAMPHRGRFIWGVTAGMIKSLYDKLYSEDGGA